MCDKRPKPQTTKERTYIDRFRSTRAWKLKRNEIKELDLYMCQICKLKLYNTLKQYNAESLQVHHIIPVKHAWDLRLDNDNLISLCPYHHELAEDGTIPVKTLLEITHARTDV